MRSTRVPTLNNDTAGSFHKAHSIRLSFNDTPEDQALYAALSASSDREHRTPLSRQTKYLLGMAMGLRRPDQLLLDRMRSSLGYPPKAIEDANVPSSSTRPPTTLRLIPGGAGGVKPGDK